jgi:DNA polymerase-4
MADRFIDRLPIRKFFGVGKVTEEKMIGLGIKTGADLKKCNPEKLIQLFGKSGSYFYHIAHGRDDRPVEPNRIRKSIGNETTLYEDIDDRDQMLEILEDIAVKLESLLIRHEAKGRTITLKIKYFDFKSITRSVTIAEPVESASVIMKYVNPLLVKTEAGPRKVRLLGISISNFHTREIGVGKNGQLLLPFKFSGEHSTGQLLW